MQEKDAIAALKRAGYATLPKKMRLPDGSVGRMRTNSRRTKILEQMDPRALVHGMSKRRRRGPRDLTREGGSTMSR